MNKTIMIFGAGINQMELIKEAKKMDITSIVVDPSENTPGKEIADFYYKVDGKDYITTKEIAIKHKVDGIVTGQMENPMRLMAKLAQELGYIFHSSEVLERSLNKDQMKKAFIQNSVGCAKGIVFSKNEKVSSDKLENFNFPLIIKPVDSFSSRGVMKVNSYAEIAKYESETRSFSADYSILIEEFLEGRELSVESITYRKETTVIQITEKFITPYPNTVEMAHLQPARISSVEKVAITDLVKNAIKAIGIDNTASHAEVILTANGPYMIEIGARLGGDFISSHLTKASTGLSMDKAAIKIALGIKPELIKTENKFSYIKYLEFPVGKIVTEILSFDHITHMEGFVFAQIFIKTGDVIMPITQSALRPACILVKGVSQLNAIKLANKYAKLITDCIKLINYA